MHVPVLLEEVRQGLKPTSGNVLIDGTLGLGGHAMALLETIGKDGRVIGFDADARNVALAQKRLAAYGDRVTYVHANFREMASRVRAMGIKEVHGVLLDLGMSSAHFDDPARGFSFQADGPLDMRLDISTGATAADLISGMTEKELADLFWRFGEERQAPRIAKAIVQARRKANILTTGALVAVIQSVAPRHGRLHPATKVFQALRMAVNDEQGALAAVLPQATELLAQGGRIAVISFHSLEDRIVKRFFKSRADLFPLTKKPIVASKEEVRANPRARSAKLRLAEKTNTQKNPPYAVYRRSALSHPRDS